MMMIMRMNTNCDVIKKSRIKVKVVMTVKTELVTAQSKGTADHCTRKEGNSLA